MAAITNGDAEPSTVQEVDAHLRAIISNLYILITQTHSYAGPSTNQAMTAEIADLITNLTNLSTTSHRLPTHIPVELIRYVEDSRNPDIYTREFVELAMRYNQQQKGRSEAYARFAEILGRGIEVGIPEMAGDVRAVMGATRAGV